MSFTVQEPNRHLYIPGPAAMNKKEANILKKIFKFDLLWKLMVEHHYLVIIQYFIPELLLTFDVANLTFIDKEIIGDHSILTNSERSWIMDKVAMVPHLTKADHYAIVIFEAQHCADGYYMRRLVQYLKAVSLKYNAPIYIIPILHESKPSFKGVYEEQFYNVKAVYSFQSRVISKMSRSDFDDFDNIVTILLYSVWLTYQSQLTVFELVGELEMLKQRIIGLTIEETKKSALLLFVKKCAQKCSYKRKAISIFAEELDYLILKFRVMDIFDEIEAKGIAIGEARGITKGITKGKAEEKVSLIAELLKNGINDLKLLAKASKLKISEVKKIQQSL